MGYTTSPGAIIRMGVEGADTSQRQIDAVASSMNRLSDTVQGAMRNLASTIGIGGGLVQIVQLSDEYTKFNAQLRLATQSQREYAIAYADVKRISKESQADLAGTGVLYARIANGTRELGVNQARVADITEVVNLALKVSGATAQEAASAQLQLSQSFASGTLRGEEFNAVNEAAPRLMKALADGIGVPVGALKQMASNGLITSKVMSDVLPKALGSLREEAQQVQTISGAFTVLKNNVMEFTAMSAQSNGTVGVLTGGIRLLADNLVLVMGAITTMTAVKVGTWLAGAGSRALEAAAANRVLLTSTVAAAEADVVATGAAVALADARVIELRAAVLAAEGQTALAITTNGLIPAQARAAVAAEAHAAALLGQSAAMRAASVAGGVLRGALAFLGGPIGLVITALGVAATAWSWYGSKADEGTRKAAAATEETTTEMLGRLDKQIEKLRERNALLAVKPEIKTANQADIDGLARAYARLQDARNGTGEYAGQSLVMRQLAEIDLVHQYNQAAEKTVTVQKLVTDATKATRDVQIKKWFDENGTQAQKMAAELEKLRVQFGTIPPEMEKLVRARYADKGAATAIKQEETAYTSLVTAIGEKIAAGKLELSGYDKLSEAQKLTVKLDEAIISGKNKLAPRHIAEARSLIDVVAAQDMAIARNKALAQIQADYAEQIGKDVETAIKEAEANEQLARTFGMTKSAIEALVIARMAEKVEQLRGIEMADDEITKLELLIEAKKRSSVALATVDGLEKQKATWESIDKTAHDVFTHIGDSAKSTVDRIRDTLKSGLLDWLYQMTVKKWIFNISASVTGNASGISGAASTVSSIANAGSIGSSLLSAVGTAGSTITAAGTLFGSSAVAAFGSGLTGAVVAGSGEAAMMASLATAGNLSAGAAAGASVGGAVSSGMAMLAAIPGWGWAALGAAAIGAYLLNDGPESNTRLNFTSNNAAGNISINERGNEGKSDTYIAGAGTKSSLGTFGVNSTFWMAAESPTVKSFLATVAQTDDALASFMTVAEKASVSSYLTGRVSIAHTGAEGTDPNAKGELDGVFRDRIANIMNGLEPGLASLVTGFTGTSQALATETASLLQYRAALNDSGEAVFGARVTLQQLAALKTPTEITSAALVRITGEFNTTNQVLDLLGKTSVQAFGASGLASTAAREQLVQLSGGMAALGTQAASFAQNYFTDAERMVPASKAVDAALATLGLKTIPATRLEFRALVDDLTSSGAAATANGAKQLAGLMAVNEAFAKVHPEIEATNSALRTQADILSERTDLQKQLDQLTMTSAELRAKERLSIDASNQAMFDQITRRQEVNATSAALKTMFDNLKSNRDGILAYRDSLQLGSLSTLTPLQRYAETQRLYTETLTKARTSPGDAAAQSAVQTAATTFLTASQVINASSAAFVTDRAKVLGDMSTLADIAGAQMSDAQLQLSLAGQQVTGITTLNTTAVDIHQAIVDLAAPGGAATPSFDMQRYTAQSNSAAEALVAEIKLLRGQVADLLVESKGRRTDADRQADEIAGATEKTAEVVAEQVAEAVQQVGWAANNPTRRVAL